MNKQGIIMQKKGNLKKKIVTFFVSFTLAAFTAASTQAELPKPNILENNTLRSAFELIYKANNIAPENPEEALSLLDQAENLDIKNFNTLGVPIYLIRSLIYQYGLNDTKSACLTLLKARSLGINNPSFQKSFEDFNCQDISNN